MINKKIVLLKIAAGVCILALVIFGIYKAVTVSSESSPEQNKSASISTQCEYKWEDSECSATCGTGTITSVLKIIKEGENCPKEKVKTRVCEKEPCPINCVIGGWNPWGACSATCGTGTQTRTPKIEIQAAFGGTACPVPDTQYCYSGPCPINCVTDGWNPWGACSVKCGTGTRTRTPIIRQHAEHGGIECPEPEQEDCVGTECPEDCEYTPGDWSECSLPCGTGTQTRSPIITKPVKHGGFCPATETRKCQNIPCPLDCEYAWKGDWTECSVQCGTGVRYRDVTFMRGPERCKQGTFTVEDECQVRPCDENDCAYTWREWSDCSLPCGTGTQTRSPEITRPTNGGFCPTTETKKCQNFPCPVGCEYGWGEWSECSRTCGSGLKYRDISLTKGNDSCPKSLGQDSDSCEIRPCNRIDCRNTWGPWSDCSSTCGVGTRTREPIITQDPEDYGMPCPTKETEYCFREPCPIDG
jgi:hypothetical protein